MRTPLLSVFLLVLFTAHQAEAMQKAKSKTWTEPEVAMRDPVVFRNIWIVP